MMLQSTSLRNSMKTFLSMIKQYVGHILTLNSRYKNSLSGNRLMKLISWLF